MMSNAFSKLPELKFTADRLSIASLNLGEIFSAFEYNSIALSLLSKLT